jgi:hypothetical protein
VRVGRKGFLQQRRITRHVVEVRRERPLVRIVELLLLSVGYCLAEIHLLGRSQSRIEPDIPLGPLNPQ